MGSAGSVFEVLALIAFFAIFSSWSFRYLFNHEIIRNYAHRTHYSKAHINGVLETQLNAKYGLRLLRLEVADESDEDGDHGRFSAEKNGYVAGSSTLPTIGHTLPYDGQQGPYNSHLQAGNGHQNGASAPNLQPSEKKRLHYVVGVLFSTSLTLSFELVLLLMIQLFGSVELNLAIFRAVITALVLLATIIQPLIVISLYINQDILPHFRWKSPTSLFKTASTLLLSGFWFVILARFGAIAHELGPDDHQSFLEEKTNEIVLAGISITAVLSGVGCMSTPIRSFWIDGTFSFKKSAKIGSAGGAEEVRLNELIQSYNSTKMLRRKRENELNQLLLATGGTVYNAPEKDSLRSLKGSGRQFLNRVQSFTSISSLTGSASEEDELRQEISSLRELHNSIYSDLSKQIDEFLGERNGTTSGGKSARFGKFMAACNFLFSIYCVYRIVNVLFLRLPYHYFWSSPDLHRASNIINDGDSSETLNKNTKDALAITISKLIQKLFGYLPMSETQLINQVSFILSGSLFVCSFQNVLVTFKSLGRFFPTHTATVNANVKTWMKHLIVSEFMAIYVIATALLIRSNLPPETAASMSKILSLTPTSSATSSAQMSAEVEFIDSWFDKVFGVSCIVTFLVLAMKLFIENDSVYDGGYDEEMIIEDNSAFKQS